MSVDSACAFAVSVDRLGSAIMQQIGSASNSLQCIELSGIMPMQSAGAEAADSAAEACQVTYCPCLARTENH